MRILLLAFLLLSLAAWGRPPVQRPVNNPRPGQATTTGAPVPKLLLAKGKVSTRLVDRIVVESTNGTKLTFLIDKTTKMPDDVEAGTQVLVNYDGTLESGVYKALLVKAVR